MTPAGGQRLDLALIALHPQLSRRKAREVIEKGQVSVDGATVVEAGAPVRAGARLTWDPNRKARPRARLSLPVLYRDDDLVVIDKPAGLLSVPTPAPRRDEDSALLRVLDFARRLKPGHPYAAAAHRLDRDTSGALCFALSHAAHAGLKALFRDHRIERRYLALVVGVPRADEGRVTLPIRDSYAGGRRGVARPGEPARPAETRWRVVERMARAALVEIELGTGRQHQIRAHLAAIGMPVLGDVVYGGEVAGRQPAPGRQMLHAALLAFAHPLTGLPVRAESPLPEDFRSALKALRRTV